MLITRANWVTICTILLLSSGCADNQVKPDIEDAPPAAIENQTTDLSNTEESDPNRMVAENNDSVVNDSNAEMTPQERAQADALARNESGDMVALPMDQLNQEPAPVAEVTPPGPFGGRSVHEVLEDPESPLKQRVFYFGYDSSSLDEASQESLSNHAELLLNNPSLSVVVEGHADERGSREYNLALGERRSQAVAKILSLQGVVNEQLQLISFGEERPVALGHDDSAWNVNRRVELLYTGY